MKMATLILKPPTSSTLGSNCPIQVAKALITPTSMVTGTTKSYQDLKKQPTMKIPAILDHVDEEDEASHNISIIEEDLDEEDLSEFISESSDERPKREKSPSKNGSK